MKAITTLSVIIFCFSSVHLSAQNTRLFYQTEQGNFEHGYSFSVSEKDGVPYFFSIKENDGTFMKLAYGPLDEETLSPLSYQYVTLPVEKDSFRYLNGVNINGNRLDLMVQHAAASSLTKVVFIEIDLDNNTVLNSYATEREYHRSFFRARAVGNTLVSYALIPSENKIVRLEKGFTGTFSVDTIPGTFNSFPAVVKESEFELINNVEYAALVTGNAEITFIRRNGDATYTTNSIAVAASAVRGWDFIQFTHNSLLFVGKTSAVEISLNLDVIEEHIESFITTTTGNSIVELLKQDAYLYLYYNNTVGYCKKLDSSLNTVDEYNFDRRINACDVYQNNAAETWLIGMTRDADGEYLENGPLGSLFISKNAEDVAIDEHHRLITLNDFNIHIGNYNRHFSQKQTGAASIFYNSGGGDAPGVIYMASDNLLAKNSSGELVGIWARHYPENKLLSGPVFTTVDDNHLRKDKYNRSYFVTSDMILNHVSNINSNPAYVMPNGIKYWPANGNTANGEPHKIVDFVDANGNGIYEPHLGEFPKIYGDQCLLTVYHQNPNDTLDNVLEVHRYLFTVDCDTNAMLKNVLFNYTKYINRGGDLSDVYVGSYIDYDIGYSADDYVGTNVQLGMIYGYNGDLFDETNGSQYGFQDSIPAMGLLMLKGAKQEDDGEDNNIGVGVGESINGVGFGDGIIDNEFYTLETSFYMHNMAVYPYADGANPVEFYNNLQGLAADGTQALGATGSYALIGQSDPDFYATGGTPHANDFSESSVGNAPGDRRMLSGSGPGVLPAGDTLNYLTAYILSFGNQNDPQGPSVGQLFTDAAKVKSYFANNDLGCGKTFGISDESLNVKTPKQLDFTIYPNPFKDELFIRHEFSGNVQLTIRNLNGQEVYHESGIGTAQQISVELTSGVYFVELTSSKGTVVKKLVRK